LKILTKKSAQCDRSALGRNDPAPETCLCPGAACDALRRAIDAALVAALHDGADVEAARANQPFDYVTLSTCRPSAPRSDAGGRPGRPTGHV